MEFAHLWHCLPNWPLSCLWFHLSSFSSSCSQSRVPSPVACCVLTTSSWWLDDWPPWLARSLLPCRALPWLDFEGLWQTQIQSPESLVVSLPVGCLILIIEALQVAVVLVVVVGSGFKEAITRIYNINELRQQFTFTFTFTIEIGFVSYSHCGYELQSFLLAKLVLVEYFSAFVVVPAAANCRYALFSASSLLYLLFLCCCTCNLLQQI